MGPAIRKSITNANDLEIGGVLDGDLAGHTITVLEGASVKGSLGAEVIIIYGAVQGTVRAKTIEVCSTAHVQGELQYSNLSILAGAEVEARCVPTSDFVPLRLAG